MPVLKFLCESVCVRNMCSDIGIVCSITVKAYSSAAKGIMTRRGCGKIKHLEAKQLWTQEHVITVEIIMVKVPRADNPSDAMTHNWSGVDGNVHFKKLGLLRESELRRGPIAF